MFGPVDAHKGVAAASGDTGTVRNIDRRFSIEQAAYRTDNPRVAHRVHRQPPNIAGIGKKRRCR
ncbi:Uncharacterised protein [Mycobacteroides abscessus subsp. abscessus]|nr:Uncharacterised protein [Mycobacteroides abscessus subsp. abscessus]